MDEDLKRLRVMSMKNKGVIRMIVRNMHLSRLEATRLWYNSETKKFTYDSDDMYFVSIPRAYEEFEMEVTNNPMWMLNPFD